MVELKVFKALFSKQEVEAALSAAVGNLHLHTHTHRQPLAGVCVCVCAGEYLVNAEVLLVAGAAVQDFQAVAAQEVVGVGVEVFKVGPQLRVEGRPEVTHLRHTHTHLLVRAGRTRRGRGRRAGLAWQA